jgi:multiple sugar transport system ATP-binding protein
MVRDSKVFLMDEPLSNLDAKLRNQMRAEIILLRQKLDTTFVYVTHDQTEAMTLGDRIVIMKDGFIQQIGTPQEVFNSPKNLFVAGFIGVPQMNFFPDSKLCFDGSKYAVEILGEKFELPEKPAEALGNGAEVCGPSGERKVVAGVRPVNVVISDDGTGIDAVIEVAEMMGSEMHLHMNASGTEVIAIVPTLNMDIDEMSAGTKLKLKLQTEAMHLFDAETEESLVK